mgnify:CR=1 FL=1
MAKHPAQQIIKPFEKALTVVQTDDSRPKSKKWTPCLVVSTEPPFASSVFASSMNMHGLRTTTIREGGQVPVRATGSVLLAVDTVLLTKLNYSFIHTHEDEQIPPPSESATSCSNSKLIVSSSHAKNGNPQSIRKTINHVMEMAD